MNWASIFQGTGLTSPTPLGPAINYWIDENAEPVITDSAELTIIDE